MATGVDPLDAARQYVAQRYDQTFNLGAPPMLPPGSIGALPPGPGPAIPLGPGGGDPLTAAARQFLGTPGAAVRQFAAPSASQIAGTQFAFPPGSAGSFAPPSVSQLAGSNFAVPPGGRIPFTGSNSIGMVDDLYAASPNARVAASQLFSRISSPFSGMAARITAPGSAAAAQALPGAAAGVAEGAAPGLLSRIGPAIGGIGMGRGLLAGGAYLGGQALASQVVDEQDGRWDDALRGAIAGAAGGTAALPGWGTLIGAVGGGLFGGLTGGDSDETERADAITEQTDRINQILTETGASDELRRQIMLQFQIGTATTEGGGDAINSLADNIMSALPDLVMSDVLNQDAERERMANIAATQAWMTPLLQSQITRQNFYSDAMSQSMLHAAQQLPPQLRATAEARARMVPYDDARGVNAMLQQIAVTPALYGMNTGTDQQGMANMDLASILQAIPAGTIAGQ